MKGTNETEVLLVRINRLFGLFIQNREIYLKNVGQKVSALEPDVRKYITSDIPEVLRLFVDWENYKIKGSVGAGLLTKTPWIAVLDSEITHTTTEGVYIVFLFSSDLQKVYIALIQGTTIPCKFGSRLSVKEIVSRRGYIRELLNIEDKILQTDNNLDVADVRYKEGVIYYSLWDWTTKNYNSLEVILKKYLTLYKMYKKEIFQKDFSFAEAYPLAYSDPYRKYFTAIQTKPFVLLAGISGTGKSRIVRELAQRSCCLAELQNKQKPGNYEIIQVRPNWHDSTELMGYVSRIGSAGPSYVITPFLQFLVKAWYFREIPFFLCLDEMNLAPVEQYFAEYLSVIETRKLTDGDIVTAPFCVKECDGKVYHQLVDELLAQDGLSDQERITELKKRFLREGISIPSNLIVMGTVNMDETTYSFSRKVLDRAMTIEMNEVDLKKEFREKQFLPENHLVNPNDVIGKYAEGKDVYGVNQPLCNIILDYLERINEALDKTPFKIAYRIRNEFMIYGIINAALDKGNIEKYDIWLDEMTAMKILSRIEGENEIAGGILDKLKGIVRKDGISAGKIEEMKERGKISGYISYWS